MFTWELRRVVKPGGVALIFEHNPYNFLTRRVVSSCIFDKDAILLKPRETRELFQGAGFRRSRSATFLRFRREPGTSSDRLFGRLPLGAQYYALGIA